MCCVFSVVILGFGELKGPRKNVVYLFFCGKD